MLPQDPPPWFVRSTAWLLIAMFGVALLAAVLVKLPETVTCPFILVPAGGADPIQSPRMAVVSKVSVTIGQTVKAGDPLYVLRSDEIRGWGTDLQTLGEDLHTHRGRPGEGRCGLCFGARNQEGGNFAGGKRSGISRKARREQSRAAHAPGEIVEERRYFAGRSAATSTRCGGIGERPERGAAHLGTGQTRAAANARPNTRACGRKTWRRLKN